MRSCTLTSFPKCPHSDLFNRLGREWLKRQASPADEREAIGRHLARTRSARRRSCRSRPRDRRGRARRRRRETADNDHRRQSNGRGGHHGGDWRHQPVRQPREAGELFRIEPSGAPIRTRRCSSWTHQQGRAQPRSGNAGRGGLGRGQARPGRCMPSSSAFEPDGAIRSPPSRWLAS